MTDGCSNENILELKKLDKKYAKGPHAVIDLDYSIQRGSISAFLGPNGAGKTTTIRMICGLCRPTGGEILFNGEDVKNAPPEYRRAIGVISQHLNLELDLSVYQNLRIHSLLYGMKKNKAEQRISSLINRSGLDTKRNARVRELSGGLRRRVQIIRALLHEPELIVLDEPTVGLDPSSRAGIWNIIRQLNREGKTILFSTHYMEEAQNHSQCISIIHQGKIIQDGTSEKLIDDIGEWCLETYNADMKTTEFFPTRVEAESSAISNRNKYEQLQIRRTSLEDVFISLTGKGLE